MNVGSNKFTTNTVRCSIEGQALIPANKTSFRPLKPDNSFKYWDKSWIVKFNIHSTGHFKVYNSPGEETAAPNYVLDARKRASMAHQTQ